jgi:hypothetical protein
MSVPHLNKTLGSYNACVCMGMVISAITILIFKTGNFAQKIAKLTLFLGISTIIHLSDNAYAAPASHFSTQI